jgi:hypothetical protein
MNRRSFVGSATTSVAAAEVRPIQRVLDVVQESTTGASRC